MHLTVVDGAKHVGNSAAHPHAHDRQRLRQRTAQILRLTAALLLGNNPGGDAKQPFLGLTRDARQLGCYGAHRPSPILFIVKLTVNGLPDRPTNATTRLAAGRATMKRTGKTAGYIDSVPGRSAGGASTTLTDRFADRQRDPVGAIELQTSRPNSRDNGEKLRPPWCSVQQGDGAKEHLPRLKCAHPRCPIRGVRRFR